MNLNRIGLKIGLITFEYDCIVLNSEIIDLEMLCYSVYLTNNWKNITS